MIEFSSLSVFKEVLRWKKFFNTKIWEQSSKLKLNWSLLSIFVYYVATDFFHIERLTYHKIQGVASILLRYYQSDIYILFLFKISNLLQPKYLILLLILSLKSFNLDPAPIKQTHS